MFKLFVHEVAEEVELDNELFNFDTFPELLTTLASKITEVEKEGFKYNSIGVGEALDLNDDEAIFVAYYVNGTSEWQFEVGATTS